MSMYMFEVPEAKRIKRLEILATDDGDNGSQRSRHSSSRQVSPSRSQPEDQDRQADVKVDYGFEYEFISLSQAQSQTQVTQEKPGPGHKKGEEEDRESSEEPSYQFRLFTKPTTTSISDPVVDRKPSLTTIRLSTTPEPNSALLTSASDVPLSSVHFVRPQRPESQYYYFTSALPPAKQALLKSQYAEVALSTRDVLSNASMTKWPGAAVPWRVIKTKVSNMTSATTKDPSNARKGALLASRPRPGSGPRLRPSKKRRIHLRRQLTAKSAATEQQKLSDEAEREKRTRRNREKKVKRKEREKRKKQEAEQAESKQE
ncbi:uncharacterized protein A1O9_11837 [Exophiala aquamarina CBS 119918]|uniref:Uncharacterized protein n=1 Tax=Exophiala aquamarina CBS 119918 TaxID=1182545 RepID=A0A072P9G8_9EURO|nr:uncharacterized protein A1O9_11837 [Exophiala aquamarina CBS 119918]KEF52210.1 hypothetical protein A1O9_11837 [Exophiala aquamarina CBS 119918]